MLKRSFTKVEEILMLVITIVLIGLLYYQLFYKVQIAERQQYDTTTLENELLIEQAKASSIRRMQEEIAENKEQQTGVVKSYNNLTEEIDILNDIFSDAVVFQFLGFDQANADGDAVRRNISASFTAESYADAKDRLQRLHDCENRCLIRNISVSPTTLTNYSYQDSNLNTGAVSVSFTVTFYETLYNATTTDGLSISSSSSSSEDSSLLKELADSKSTVENME